MGNNNRVTVMQWLFLNLGTHPGNGLFNMYLCLGLSQVGVQNRSSRRDI